MNFQLFYTKTAVRDIKKLDPVAKNKIRQKLELYSQKPLSFTKKLIHPKIGTYRWRIGNYRVIFDLHGHDIIILRVGHRRELYK